MLPNDTCTRVKISHILMNMSYILISTYLLFLYVCTVVCLNYVFYLLDFFEVDLVFPSSKFTRIRVDSNILLFIKVIAVTIEFVVKQKAQISALLCKVMSLNYGKRNQATEGWNVFKYSIVVPTQDCNSLCWIPVRLDRLWRLFQKVGPLAYFLWTSGFQWAKILEGCCLCRWLLWSRFLKPLQRFVLEMHSSGWVKSGETLW